MVLIEAPVELVAAATVDNLEGVGPAPEPALPEALPEDNKRSWLLIAFASMGTLAFASSFAWYAWSRSQTNIPPQVAVSQMAEATPSTIPPVSESEQVSQPVDEPLDAIDSELDTEKEITSAEVDPFHEGERTGLFGDRTTVDPIVETVTVAPVTNQQEPTPAVDPLSSLAALLDNSNQAPPTVERAAEVATPELSDVETTQVSNPASKPDIQGLLKRPIPSIRFQGVPLIQFVRSMSKLSGVTISLDADSLQLAAIRTSTPISIAKQDASSIDILNAALRPAGLATIVESDVVRVVSRRTADNNPTRLTLPVGDLLQGASRDLDIASLITSFVGPTSWNAAGGSGSADLAAGRLSISTTKSIAVETVVFLEKLRIARSLAPQKRIPSSLTDIVPRWKRIARRLSIRVNVDAWRETPLLDVVAQIEKAAGVRILMDWQALATYKIGPSTEVSHYARNVDLNSAIAALIPENDLMVIPIDRNTIQVTTREAGQSRPYIEFYAFSALGEAGLKRIEPFILGGSAILDPGSEYAIMLGDADMHRQVIGKR